MKTRASERIVPIHPALIAANLLDHWRGCHSRKQVRLWAELNLDRFGYASAYFSKWFGRYLTTVGAAKERTCFHSFRHCFRGALRAGRVDREVAHALGGWISGPSGHNTVADAYGGGFPVTLLAAAVSQVAYDIPAISYLTQRKMRLNDAGGAV